MAQLAAAAGDANDSVDATGPTDSATDIADFLGLEPDEIEPDEEEEGDALDEENEGEETDEADEPELPAIAAPVSWNADAKKQFEQLPRELQEVVSAREADRERFVQTKATEAANARQAADTEARQAIAQLSQQAAAQLRQYEALIVPQLPDPALIQTDPQGYLYAKAQYDAAVAQLQQVQQQANAYEAHANQQVQAVQEQQKAVQVERLRTEFPEWFDATANHQQQLTAIAKEMGYPDDLLPQADANDILALRKAAGWKAKADKLDALNASKMTKVREAKTLPKVTKPGIAQGTPSKQAKAAEAWDRVRGARTKDSQSHAFADFLENSGYL